MEDKKPAALATAILCALFGFAFLILLPSVPIIWTIFDYKNERTYIKNSTAANTRRRNTKLCECKKKMTLRIISILLHTLGSIFYYCGDNITYITDTYQETLNVSARSSRVASAILLGLSLLFFFRNSQDSSEIFSNEP